MILEGLLICAALIVGAIVFAKASSRRQETEPFEHTDNIAKFIVIGGAVIVIVVFIMQSKP